jgi:hypothetical protein
MGILAFIETPGMAVSQEALRSIIDSNQPPETPSLHGDPCGMAGIVRLNGNKQQRFIGALKAFLGTNGETGWCISVSIPRCWHRVQVEFNVVI